MKPKKSRKNCHRSFCRFLLKKFSTWTFYKSMSVVFLNSQKRTDALSPLACTCTTWGLGGGGGGTPGARGVGAKNEE
jgi:hypothetical protein